MIIFPSPTNLPNKDTAVQTAKKQIFRPRLHIIILNVKVIKIEVFTKINQADS